MTRAEILRHLEADSTSGLAALRECVHPYSFPEEVRYALTRTLHRGPEPLAVESIGLWRLLLTLLEAE